MKLDDLIDTLNDMAEEMSLLGGDISYLAPSVRMIAKILEASRA